MKISVIAEIDVELLTFELRLRCELGPPIKPFTHATSYRAVVHDASLSSLHAWIHQEE